MLALTPLQDAELGLSWDQIVSIYEKAEKYIDVISGVVEDKNLDPFVSRVKQIAKLHASPTAPAVTPATQTSPGKVNVNLGKFLGPMDAYIYVRKNQKWLIPVGIAGAVLVLGGIGFTVGRLTKRCKCPI